MARASTKSLLRLTLIESRRSTDNSLLDGPLFHYAKAWQKHYKTLSDGQPLANIPAQSFLQNGGEEWRKEPQAFVMRTTDIEAQSESEATTHGEYVVLGASLSIIWHKPYFEDRWPSYITADAELCVTMDDKELYLLC